jgi:hypothetical protein
MSWMRPKIAHWENHILCVWSAREFSQPGAGAERLRSSIFGPDRLWITSDTYGCGHMRGRIALRRARTSPESRPSNPGPAAHTLTVAANRGTVGPSRDVRLPGVKLPTCGSSHVFRPMT